ncbi:MAG: hypothetical protein ACUVQT_08825 [bacterium]
MKKNTKICKMADQDKEHIFRFELIKPEMFFWGPDAIALVVGANKKAILDVVVLTYKGKEVEVDGFKFVENDNEFNSLYPHVKRQRCWVHKLRNVAQRLPARYREECLKGAQWII